LQTLKEMRLLLHQLRPLSLEQGGFLGALNRRFEQVERRLGIVATADVEEGLTLPRRVEESIYLITTEALNNSLKHSSTKSVYVQLGHINGNIELVVEDDGQGFDPSKPTAGMGLNNMHERADLLGGSIEIQSTIGDGTRIHLSMPQPMKRE
jgi:signal transduction histidine kinase